MAPEVWPVTRRSPPLCERVRDAPDRALQRLGTRGQTAVDDEGWGAGHIGAGPLLHLGQRFDLRRRLGSGGHCNYEERYGRTTLYVALRGLTPAPLTLPLASMALW